MTTNCTLAAEMACYIH